MLRRYQSEPVPSVTRSTHTDELVDPPAPTSTPPGTGELGEPEEQRGGSRQYHRPPVGGLLSADIQSVGLGAEVKQSGAGRAFVPGGLSFPVQSDTPMPDHRRIARPMPTVSRDDTDVIRPPGAANE